MLTRDLEDGPVGEGFDLVRLAGYVSYHVAPSEALLMELPNLCIHPSMDELTIRHVPCLVFEHMIVHAGFRPFTEDQQFAAIELMVSKYKLFSPALRNSRSMCGYRFYHLRLKRFWFEVHIGLGRGQRAHAQDITQED